ncbi:hypothetical protein [Fibrella aquatilis]|nr:hypothetical protein [Fibrella aquatilis]
MRGINLAMGVITLVACALLNLKKVLTEYRNENELDPSEYES